MSKIQDAMALYDSGVKAYTAAVQVGLQPSAIYREIKRRRSVVVCPCCGSRVEELFVSGHIVKQLRDITKTIDGE